MAEQLRRAPWFMISIVVHALALFVLYLLVEEPKVDSETRAIIAIDPDAPPDELVVDDEIQDEVVEVESVVDDPLIEEVLDAADFSEPDVTENVFEPHEFEAFHPLGPAEMLEKIRPPAGESAINSLGTSPETEEFKRRITSLRRSGLDIVFVFDSTSSMDDVIDETKSRIATMVDVLHELVDNARIGVVTYRDHGDYEEYLTRDIPLGDDYYRIVNFMQTVFASGGGDFPEAVYDALRLAATRMKWRPGSQRVIVLIGDAPAKEKDESKIKGMIRTFARGKDACVHTIMTARDIDGIDEDCRNSFTSIAKSGGGSCIPLENEAVILLEVMSLAFGRQYRRSIDSIYEYVNQRRSKISARARDLVRRRDLAEIDRALLKTNLDDELVRALARSEDSLLASHLVDLLVRQHTPKHARHAIAHALQKILNLHTPPIDPEGQSPITHAKAKLLRQLIERDLR